MHTQKNIFFLFITLSFFCSVSLPLRAENKIYEFGPQTDNVLVFTASLDKNNKPTHASNQLEQFAMYLAQHQPDKHILIAITKNNISDLPQDIPVRRLSGTRNLITTLSTYSNPRVCIISNGNQDSATIIAGTKKVTAPPDLLQSAYTALQLAHIPISYYSNSLIFYRMELLDNDDILKLYHDAYIPAIKIKTEANIATFLGNFIQYSNKPVAWDRHYFTQIVGNTLFIIQEQVIVIILLISFMIILFTLIIFSFLFGKQKHKHLKDLFTLSWMPVYFFCINTAGFFIGTRFTSFLFSLLLEHPEDIALFPFSALLLKHAIVVFFIFMVIAFNRFMPLPKNTVIYGFMANAVCALNIFIFSFINLSLSVFFIGIYLISFVACRVKSIFLQTLFILLLFTPLAPFMLQSFLHSHILFPLIFNSCIKSSLLCIPFDLLLIRLFLTAESQSLFQRKPYPTLPVLHRRSIHCITAGIIVIVITIWICIMPKDEKTDTRCMYLIEKITNNHHTVITKYYKSGKAAHATEEIKDYIERNSLSVPKSAKNFIQVKSSFINYFERSIGMLHINSTISVESLIVTLHSNNHSMLFEANRPFEKNISKNLISFTSVPRPKMPFQIHFSEQKNAEITVTITLWSKDNPYGIALPKKMNQNNHFLFKVQKSFILAAKNEPST